MIISQIFAKNGLSHVLALTPSIGPYEDHALLAGFGGDTPMTDVGQRVRHYLEYS